MDEENSLNLEDLTISNVENNEEKLNSLISTDIDLDNLNIDDFDGVESDLESNTIIDNNEALTLGLTKEQINEFYEYLAGNKPRPVFAERFFADSESRIRESNQLATMMGLSFIPKLLAVQESLINNLTSEETLKYLSTDERIGYLQTFAAISTKFNDIALKYTQAQRDFSGVPLIYRQLLDQLLIIPQEKLPRLKLLPNLVDLPDDIWDRIIEIAKLDK